MRWIGLAGLTVLVVGFSLTSLTPARAGHTPPKVKLGVHIQTTGEGQSQLEAMTIAVPPDGEQILIRTLPEASDLQLIGVAEQANGAVRLQFNHAGQVALSAATAENQGRFLVVLIDGQVVYAPIIDVQITDGQLVIPRPLPPEIVRLLADVAQENVRRAAR
ncbi:MAG: hypothetical protein WDO13_02385, partial [Verrucomicrobiota bacterium]